MTSLSTFVLRHKLLVVLFWLAVFVAGMAASGRLSDQLSQDFSYPGREGYEANVEILRSYGSGGPGNPLVPVVTLPAGTTVDTPGVRERLGTAFAAAGERLGGRAVSYPSTGDRRFVTGDGRTVFAVLSVPYQGEDSPDLSPALEEALAGAVPPGSTVEVTGLDVLSAQAGDAEESADTGVLIETLAGAVGALVVLLFVFGSLLALVPLIMAAVSILTTLLLILGLTQVTEVNFLVQYLVSLIGLGVAIDYSLLVVTRWREERSRGYSSEEAVRRAMATAGRAVVFSGIAVAAGLLILVLLPVPFLRSVGYGSILIPLVSTVVALTLLPVLLATVGARLDWPRLRKDRSAGRLWTRWAGWVVRRPVLAIVAALLVLGPLTAAAFTMRTGDAPSGAVAQSGPAHEALERLDAPSGVLTPIEVLLPAGADPDRAARQLATVDGVYAAARSAGTLVTVLPVDETSTAAGRDTVERVRDAVAGGGALAGARVGGSGALLIDAIGAMYGYFPLMLAVIALVTFALLARAFRSILLALQAIVLNLISIAAAYGVLVLVWQEGYGSELFWGIPATGSVTAWVPLMTFAFLFGLSMDYEVFLLSRMREEYDATGSTRAAVVEGLGRIGRLVTSAALILFLAFASLAALPEVDVKTMATGLGAGILIDATILRALLVPALVTLGGRRTWWLPAWAARLLRMRPEAEVGDAPVAMARTR